MVITNVWILVDQRLEMESKNNNNNKTQIVNNTSGTKISSFLGENGGMRLWCLQCIFNVNTAIMKRNNTLKSVRIYSYKPAYKHFSLKKRANYFCGVGGRGEEIPRLSKPTLLSSCFTSLLIKVSGKQRLAIWEIVGGRARLVC